MTKPSLKAALLLTALSGCSKPPDPPFPSHLPSEKDQYNRGFELYAQAARQIEQDDPKQINRTSWTPDQKETAMRRGNKALSLLSDAVRSQAEFVFTPRPFVITRPYARGWRFLGRLLQWKIDKACAEGDFAAGVRYFLESFRFGAFLTQGDALDASLGAEIMDKSGESLWKYLEIGQSSQLNMLYSGIARAVAAMPSAGGFVEHERLTMLADVQWLQDRYRANEYTAVKSALGSVSDAPLRYWRELKTKPVSRQIAFFKGMGKEAEAEAQLLYRLAERPLTPQELAEPSGERPWRRFAASLFRTGRAYLQEREFKLTKLKLLGLDAALMAKWKKKLPLPASLVAFPAKMRLDPFSGRDFVYAPQGANYKLYSVGPDQVDDGGEPQLDITLGR